MGLEQADTERHTETEDMEKVEETKQRIGKTSAVLWHARQNDSKGLNKLLQRNPSLANARDYDGRTALHVAAIHGCTEAARCLLQHEASVNALDRWQNSVSLLPPWAFCLLGFWNVTAAESWAPLSLQPLADAENGNHEAMIELLKTYGAQSQVISYRCKTWEVNASFVLILTAQFPGQSW
eukprot:TRINITY_DN2486_c0_g1_i12.p2 TRINITY_DN2486_c0_g1~~TRINITY_DN2486_c0_g1_i12.p2  ORF type:complete len:181 (-),score=39.92 TRINITY_DN2486_c0_g1_i12:1114-1656(-)